MKNKVSIFWFRRDLRLTDNTGLHHALGSEFPVLPIFIFDTDILDQLEDKKDRRVDYIHQALTAINSSLKKYGSKLRIYYGKPMETFRALSEEYDIEAVFVTGIMNRRQLNGIKRSIIFSGKKYPIQSL